MSEWLDGQALPKSFHKNMYSAHLSLVTYNYSESQCAQPGNRTCKTPNIMLDTLPTTLTVIANINGYHQLGLLTSK